MSRSRASALTLSAMLSHLRSVAGRSAAVAVRPAAVASSSASAPAVRSFSAAAAAASHAPHISPILSRLRDPTLFKTQCFIDGEWVGRAVPSAAAAAASVTDHTHRTINVRSPTSGEILGSIPRLGASETNQAIEAAQRAFPLWAGLTAKARADHLQRWHQLCIEHKEDLATILTMEQGKPFAEALGEVSGRGRGREKQSCHGRSIALS